MGLSAWALMSVLTGFGQGSPCGSGIGEKVSGIAALTASGKSELAGQAVRSLEMEVRSSCPDDSSIISDLSYLKGTLFLLSDDPDSAMACFRDAREYAVSLIQLSRIDQNTGAAWFDASEYEKAVRYFKHSISEMEASGSRPPRRLMQLYDNLGSACFENGSFEEAGAWWEKSQGIAEALFPLDSAILSGILNKNALVQVSMKNWKDAAALFGRALEMQPSGNLAREGNQAVILKNLVIAKVRSGDLEGASQVMERLKSKYREDLAEDPVFQAEVLRVESWTAFAGNNFLSADSLLGKAVESITVNPPETRRAGSRLVLFRLLRDRASIGYLQQEREERTDLTSLQKLNRMQTDAFRALNQMRVTGGELPAFILAHDSVEVLLKRTLETGALLIRNQPGIARELLSMAEVLHLHHRRPDAMLTGEDGDVLRDSLSAEWLRLNRKLLRAETGVLRSVSFTGNKDLAGENLIFTLRGRLDSLSAQMTADGISGLMQAASLSPDEPAVPCLDADEAILDYFLFPDKMFLFIALKDSVRLLVRETGPGFETAVTELIQSLHTADDYLFRKASPGVSELLTEPAVPLLNSVRRLYIIPGKSLRNIPFECLQGKGSSGTPEYLAGRFAITYHASLRDITPDPDEVTLKDCLVFAPGFGSGTCLDDLADAAGEAQEVAGMFRSRGLTAGVFSGGEANEAAFVAALQAGRIIHIATHSRMNDSDPGASGLHLWKQPPPGSGDELLDGIFEMKEISSVRLRCDLLTLSSCTTDGEPETADGCVSARYAFLDAGAGRVLSSLWDVSDRHTRTLMVNFYRFVLNGDDYAEALRKAKIKMLRDPATSSPYLWAPFILSTK